MLHTKSQVHRPSGSGEEDFFKGFQHIWAWRPSWSCEQDHLNKLCNLDLIGPVVSEEMFEIVDGQTMNTGVTGKLLAHP